MMLHNLFACTIWCLSSALTIAVNVQDVDNQILVTGEVTLTDCQIKDLSRWDKVLTMLENSQMRQNMLLQNFEEVKVELQTVKEDLGAGSCSDCLSSITSDISRLLDSKCEPDVAFRKNVEKSILNLDIIERLDRIENAFKKWEEDAHNKAECPDKEKPVSDSSVLIEQLHDWVEQRHMPSGCDTAILFPMRSPKIYASAHPADMTLQAFTFCMWTKVTEALEKTIVFSYGTKHNPYEIQLYLNQQSPVLVVGGDKNKVSADNAVQAGKWSYLCGTWNSEDGKTALWVNGEHKATSPELAQGHIIPGRGLFQLGQEKNGCCVGGGFDESLSFSGKITGFNLWDKVLSDDDIVKTSTGFDCSIRGNVIGWGTTEIQPHGGAQYIHSSF
ncbi:pentraxin-related protein PTX3 [Bufo gargarizans]|uniref:pentraxin-related protein PTX3 n=1 Tax=Bufo gargarizans TaxID=30331 RepID=UPI001CF59B22|nr:pentraxin-related protein PTX3 [Bufo gargarizans]